MTPLELTVGPHLDSYTVCWADGTAMASDIPEIWLDLIPFMAARKLLEHGNNPERWLIVRLQGADRELMRAPLSYVAATPQLSNDPVGSPARCIYREPRRA